ncbi:hypothetical protein [Thermoanaerobacter sp. RKWS2]|uniref:hypothetical protein n=1 Tax=Thermoanaerobacter sp. RKWS2 TaxID=2983842 RepID=UPI00224A4DBB|nr:hypothetical protein [Thermoanaerobacter sp. RKWS2]UZQ84260.1 hypothetical protein OEI98_001469 [Thermoanaerobacter sp. RKWS2]
MRKVKLLEVLSKLDENANPYQRFVQFYEALGWDKTSPLNPLKIKLNQSAWTRLVSDEMRRAEKFNMSTLEIGFLWADKGPSADTNVEEGIIIVEEGAFL